MNGERFIIGGWDGEGNAVSTTGKSISMRNLTFGYAGRLYASVASDYKGGGAAKMFSFLGLKG